jgi:hypothetical protein
VPDFRPALAAQVLTGVDNCPPCAQTCDRFTIWRNVGGSAHERGRGSGMRGGVLWTILAVIGLIVVIVWVVRAL